MSPTDSIAASVDAIRTSLQTGNLEDDIRSWVVAGAVAVLAVASALLAIQDFRNGQLLVAAIMSALFGLMLVSGWLLVFRGNIDAAAKVTVLGLCLAATAALALTGGKSGASYVVVCLIVVIATTVSNLRFAALTTVVCVMIALFGLWLQASGWQFPISPSDEQFTWKLARVSVLSCIVAFVVLTISRRSAESVRKQYRELQVDAQEANEMLSSLVVEHLNSMQLQAKLQKIGKLGGWWFCPQTRIVHHTVGFAGVLEQFSLDDLSSNAALEGLSRHELREVITEVIEGKQPWDHEIKVTDATGNTKWFRSTGELEYEDDGVSKVFGVHHDITEVRRAQDEQARGQKLEAIGTLAAGMAHEINTPGQFVGDNLKFLKDAYQDMLALNQSYAAFFDAAKNGPMTPEIVGQVEAAVEEADPEYLGEEIPMAIEQSIDGVSRITKIVRAMKEFSHPGGGTWESVDLNQMIDNTIIVATNEWKYAAEIETDLDRELPAVPCSQQDISQVVLNLIVNAAHAIADALGDSSADKGVIRISTKRVGEVAEMRVADSGCGIPEELRERVFEPFFTTKEVGRGTGQGLTMAYKTIVDKHSGTLQLESTVGEGSTFIITLPLIDSRDD